MKFIDTKTNNTLKENEIREAMIRFKGREVILKDIYKGLIHVELLGQKEEYQYKILNIKGKEKSDSDETVELLYYHNLEELYLVS